MCPHPDVWQTLPCLHAQSLPHNCDSSEIIIFSYFFSKLISLVNFYSYLINLVLAYKLLKFYFIYLLHIQLKIVVVQVKSSHGINMGHGPIVSSRQ